MYRINIADAPQQALGFLVAQTSLIEPEVIKIAYPDIQYPMLIPVDTTGPQWVKSVTFFSSDMVGKAQWFHHEASDIALSDVTRDKHEVGIEMAGIGYRYTLEELGQAMMIPGYNLSADRAAAARRAYEEFVDNVALRGDTNKTWTGLINSPLITAVLAPADGTAGSPHWVDKTPAQIMRDINGALVGIYTQSLTVEMADTVLLPISALASLATLQVPNTAITVLEWIAKYNIYTMQTGQPLTMRGVRGLDKAAADGGGRMVAYRRDPQVLKLHIPMPHQFLPVWQRGPITFDIPGIFRLGGLEIRRPGAMRYVDDISVATSP